jgi:hypothetical protein
VAGGDPVSWIDLRRRSSTFSLFFFFPRGEYLAQRRFASMEGAIDEVGKSLVMW